MGRSTRPLALLVLVTAIATVVPRSARCVESDPEVDAALGRAARMAVDVFPVRFGSFLRMTVGGVFLVPATLFSAAAYPFQRDPAVFRDNVDLYVGDAFEYTFRRPLGEDFGGS